MAFARTSGILLHPTSFPGRYGIGDLGEAAYRWIDFLAETGQTLWQIMPLSPTGYGDSPYQSFSAFAGNPLLISLDTLVGEHLLADADVANVPDFPAEHVDFGPVIEWKMKTLMLSLHHFKSGSNMVEQSAFATFERENTAWLDDFALFMALKEVHGGASWNEWEAPIRGRQPAALAEWTTKLADSIEAYKYLQFLFFKQWAAVKAYANDRNIQIVGDVPIFVAYDSTDVWANPDLFYLDPEGNPTQVAGVPPDYFSATGQMWGNPLYRWDAMAATGYEWWLRRFRAILTVVDIVRIDHFRGFDAYWAIPAGEPTAVNGKWESGPGLPFFKAIEAKLGELPIIAEDLGLITRGVREIRDTMGFPGMKVLQFAFSGDPRHEYLPHTYPRNCVVYSGTHDNDTTVGWYATSTEKERDMIRRYLQSDGHEINWDFIRLAFGSVAIIAVMPLQDVLGLGGDARMNTPGTASGNWGWRYTSDALTDTVRGRLKEVTYFFGRGLPPLEETDRDPAMG